MRSIRLSVPIRLKILVLVAGALLTSLVANLYVGTGLMVEDKISYIYEINRAQLESSAEVMRSKIEQAVTGARTLGATLPGSGAESAAVESWRTINEKRLGSLNVEEAWVLRPTEWAHTPQVVAHLGSKKAQGWVEKFGAAVLSQTGDQLVGEAEGGWLPIGVKTTDAAGQPVAILLAFPIQESALRHAGKDIHLLIADAKGVAIVQSGGFPALPAHHLSALSEDLSKSKFDSGVMDWTANPLEPASHSFVVGYQRLPVSGIMLISFTPREIAYQSARSLANKSFAIGLSIFLIVAGITLLFARGITSRLQQMWQVTQKVSQGDFSSRVYIKGRSKDEISDLALSFNSMASRIDDLMLETANKARMEQELETAQIIQNRFFPPHDLESPAIQVAGRYLPASECSGDWWSFRQLGSRTLVIIGDVTGHGVSSALVTSAAHGAFSVLLAGIKPDHPSDSLLQAIIESLNCAVFNAGSGDIPMTFFAAVFDTQARTVMYANSSHRPPYVFAEQPASPRKKFRPLQGAKSSPLGLYEKISVEIAQEQLAPGDSVFLYTDGLLECGSPDGTLPSKAKLMDKIHSMLAVRGASARGFSDQLLRETITFLGGEAAARADDITFVTVCLPSSAAKAA